MALDPPSALDAPPTPEDAVLESPAVEMGASSNVPSMADTGRNGTDQDEGVGRFPSWLPKDLQYVKGPSDSMMDADADVAVAVAVAITTRNSLPLPRQPKATKVFTPNTVHIRAIPDDSLAQKQGIGTAVVVGTNGPTRDFIEIKARLVQEPTASSKAAPQSNTVFSCLPDTRTHGGRCLCFGIILVLVLGAVGTVGILRVAGICKPTALPIPIQSPSKEPTIMPPPTGQPTTAPSARANQLLTVIMEEVHNNPVTLVLDTHETLPRDPNFYQGLLDSGVDCLLVPHQCAMAWALFKDNFLLATDHVAHRFAMASLYYSFGGRGWKLTTSWMTNSSYCDWHGITCNRAGTEIQAIDLSSNGLVGEIPLALALVDTVLLISFQDNDIHGTLPGNVFANLPNLFSLYLQSNDFVGTIPSNLRNNGALELLFLHHNNFTGPFPQVYCSHTRSVFKELRLDCDDNPCPHYCCFPSSCF